MNDEKSRPVVMYLVTEDWYFLSHRLPMALTASNAGYTVHVITNVTQHGPDIERLGFSLHPLSWRRGSINPFRLAKTVRAVRSIYRTNSPDIVHHVALSPSIVGSVAAIGLPIRRVNAIAGLGYVFSSTNLKARLLRRFITMLLRLMSKNSDAIVLVQNPDDRAEVAKLGVAADHLFLIPGSGVDINSLRPRPEPPGLVTITFVGRLLVDKGIRTLIAAYDILQQRGENLQLLIAGDRDPANPASIPQQEIESWRHRPGVTVLGHFADIDELWARSHIAVLPSRREGLPKSLLEAAACGRPIVASDVPGCREIARHNINALLVPTDNPQALADAIGRLARDPDLRRRFGLAGRHLAETEFASARIGREMVSLYDKLLGLPDRPNESQQAR